MRVDKWLWAARFYKTRSLAAQAVNNGRVLLNGARIKPARTLKPGDTLEIRRDGLSWVVDVLALSGKRGPASVARTLYREHEESIRRREFATEQIRLAAAASPRPERRPDKKSRRLLRNLKG